MWKNVTHLMLGFIFLWNKFIIVTECPFFLVFLYIINNSGFSTTVFCRIYKFILVFFFVKCIFETGLKNVTCNDNVFFTLKRHFLHLYELMYVLMNIFYMLYPLKLEHWRDTSIKIHKKPKYLWTQPT